MSTNIRNYAVKVTETPLSLRKQLHQCLLDNNEPIYSKTKLHLAEQYPSYNYCTYFSFDGYDWCGEEHPDRDKDRISIEEFLKLFDKSSFKVGDKVKIRTDLIIGHRYSMLTKKESHSCGYVKAMKKYEGSIATITNYDNTNFYTLDIDGGDWSWVDEMFEGLANTDAAQVVQEEVQMKYKIGDKFVNSSGNFVTIVDIENIRTREYKYKVQNGRVFTVAEESIDRNWKLIKPTNTPLQAGMKIKVRSDLKDQDYYNITGDTSLKMRPNLDMLTKKGQEVTIIEVVVNPSNTQQYYYRVEGLPAKKWSDEMFDFQVKDTVQAIASVAGTTTVVSANTATNTVAQIQQNKGQTMSKRTIVENAGAQLQEVKAAGINAAELKAGQIINAQVIKLVKPKLPMMLRGYADSPVASVVLANVVGIALKQYAPDNAKLAKVSSLMLNAAALDAVDAFNIDGLVDDLLAGVKLPAGVSLDADAE